MPNAPAVRVCRIPPLVLSVDCLLGLKRLRVADGLPPFKREGERQINTNQDTDNSRTTAFKRSGYNQLWGTI